MNMHSNITPKPPRATAKQALEAFEALEGAIYELMQICDIGSHFIEDINMTPHVGEYGQASLMIERRLADRLVFSVYKAHEMAVDLNDRFHCAWDAPQAEGRANA